MLPFCLSGPTETMAPSSANPTTTTTTTSTITSAYFQSARSPTFRLIGSLLCLLSLLVIGANAETCRKLISFNNVEDFQCPRLFESKKKSWCCGSNSLDSHCCEWSKRAKETIPDINFKVVSDASFKFILLTVVSLLFIVMLIFICCYLIRYTTRLSDYTSANVISDGCCLMGRVTVNGDGTTQLSHMGSLPAAPYPIASANYPANQQQISDDPPPSYFELFSAKNNVNRTNKVPLSAIVPGAPSIVEAGGHQHKADQPLLLRSSLEEVTNDVDSMSLILSRQPPFNPAFIAK